MNKTTVVQFKTASIAALFRESYVLLIMFASYIFGAILGASLLNTSDAVNAKAKVLFESFKSARVDSSFFSTFLSSVMSWLPFMLILFVCGTCIVGMVILPLFICYKGFCYGALAGYIYSSFSFSGIIFILILIIPGTIIGAFGLFFAGKKSFNFSLILAKSVLPRSREYSMYNILIHYCKGFAFLLIITFVSALVDATLSTAFFDKINFV